MRQFRGIGGLIVVLVVTGLVVAGLLGLRTETPPPATATSTPAPTNSPAATVAPRQPSPSETPRGPIESLRVYFPRDELPPVGADVRTEVHFGPTHEGYIRARFDALLAGAAAPGGATNPLSTLRTHPTVQAVTISGDLVTVDWKVLLGSGGTGDWGIGGSAATVALIQQLVYTATEEPGIKRAMFTENGGKPTIIDQAQVDRPVTRENVFGYDRPGSLDPLKVDGPARALRVTTSASVEKVAPALARFVITFEGSTERVPPQFTATMTEGTRGSLPGKYELDVVVPQASDGTTVDTTVGQTPLRAYAVALGGGVAYRLGLDDLRPWRAMVLFDPTRIVIDIGGAPGAVSVDGNTAIYAPARGAQVGRTFHLSGAARAFEATYLWRVKDSSGRVVAGAPGVASIGTSALWGAFETDVTLPATVTGFVTLEVYQTSPKDGSETSLAGAHLAVRP